MQSPDEPLAQAYRDAVYKVNGFELRIDEPHPDFDAWLSREGCAYYLILTAFNPYSTPLPDPVNEARHQTLLELLDRRGERYVAASGSDPEGGWPEERGLCLLDISPAEGYAIGRLYEQHAIVEGSRGGTPQLRWL